MASIHDGVVFSPRKKEVLPFVTTWLDLKDLILSELSDRKRQILCDLVHMENLIRKKKKSRIHRYRKQTGCQRKEVRGGQSG